MHLSIIIFIIIIIIIAIIVFIINIYCGIKVNYRIRKWDEAVKTYSEEIKNANIEEIEVFTTKGEYYQLFRKILSELNITEEAAIKALNFENRYTSMSLDEYFIHVYNRFKNDTTIESYLRYFSSNYIHCIFEETQEGFYHYYKQSQREFISKLNNILEKKGIRLEYCKNKDTSQYQIILTDLLNLTVINNFDYIIDNNFDIKRFITLINEKIESRNLMLIHCNDYDYFLFKIDVFNRFNDRYHQYFRRLLNIKHY